MADYVQRQCGFVYDPECSQKAYVASLINLFIPTMFDVGHYLHYDMYFWEPPAIFSLWEWCELPRSIGCDNIQSIAITPLNALSTAVGGGSVRTSSQRQERPNIWMTVTSTQGSSLTSRRQKVPRSKVSKQLPNSEGRIVEFQDVDLHTTLSYNGLLPISLRDRS